MVVLHALGECVIRTSLATITPRADLGFALAARLIAQRGRRISRRALVALFWPDATPSNAAHALSEALHKLRRKGLPIRIDDSLCVWLASESVSTDIDHLAREPPCSLLDRDLTILPGYAPAGSPRFYEWLDDWREDLRQTLVGELRAATERAELEGDAPTVVGLAAQLLRLEPHDSVALHASAAALNLLVAETGAPNYPVSNNHAPPAISARSARQHFGSTTCPGWAISTAGIAAAGFPTGGSSAARQTRMVGREVELALGLRVLDTARGGCGGALYLFAGAGIGKSRLVCALASAARARGMLTVTGVCQNPDLQRPLSALIDLVPKLRGLPGAAGASPTLAPYLDRLTNLGARDRAGTQAVDDAEHNVECIRHAIFDLVDAVAEEQPLLMVVENVQWLDPVPWALLRELATRCAERSALLIFTSRNPWDAASYGEIPTSVLPCRLHPLTETAASEHATEYAKLIGDPAPPGLVEWCIEASEGNPYLMEELLNHWHATGETFAAPRSLTRLLEARLLGLTPPSRRLLQTCAILGRNSTLDRLDRLLGYQPHRVLDALEELGNAGLLTTERTCGSGLKVVRCRHDVLKQTAIGRLSRAGLEWLHGRAGEILDSELDEPGSTALVWDCAAHWHAAGNSDRAVELGRSCVNHLLHLGLAHEAAKGCRLTLTFCSRADDRINVSMSLARALHLTRSWAELFALIIDIRALQQDRGGTGEQVDHELELLSLDAERHASRDWHAILERACSAVAANANPCYRVRAGIIALELGTSLGQADVMTSVARTLEPLLDSHDVCRTDRLTFQMTFHAVCGTPSVCISAARDLLANPDEGLPELPRLAIAVNCASALFRAGEVDAAERAYCNVAGRLEELGATALLVETCTQAAATYLDFDDITFADAWTRRNLRASASHAGAAPNPPLRFALARIELANGNVSAASHLLQNGKQPLWKDPVDIFRCAALAAKVRVELAADPPGRDIGVLVRELERLSSRFRPMGGQDFETFSLYLGLSATGKRADGERILANYVARERRDFTPVSVEITSALDASCS